MNANWTLVPDGDPKVGSKQTLTLSSEGAIKVTYEFEKGWKLLRLVSKNNILSKIEGKPQSLIIRINPDDSGNSIRIRFRDSKGQTFQATGTVLNKKEIHNVTFDLTGKEHTSHWGDPNDGIIYYPIVFDSFIIDGTNEACGPYSIDIFSPMLVY